MMNFDFLSLAFVIASIAVILITFLQQRKQTQDQLKARDEQIQQKNEIIDELKAIMTGGESYFFLRPSKVANENEVLFILEFRGKYPVYDSSITIEEFNYKITSPGFFAYEKVNQKNLDVGTIHPLRQKNLFTVKVPVLNGNEQFGRKYFFSINTRNGVIEEDVLIRQEGAHFSFAYKVVRIKPKYSDEGIPSAGIDRFERKIRHIDPTFPVHEMDHLEGDTGWLGTYDEVSGTGIHR
jgi:hypothetical protein